MKILRFETLINQGQFGNSDTFKLITRHIQNAINSIENPSGCGSFALYDQKQGNGVKPIKEAFITQLIKLGWNSEERIDVTVTAKQPGPIDAAYPLGNNTSFAVEWETGNISSSHRALNKIAVGMLEGILLGGILVLPSRQMYYYLTDRVGNFEELEPYFPVWKALNTHIANGILQVIEIEHDFVSTSVPKIMKGTDGRAFK